MAIRVGMQENDCLEKTSTSQMLHMCGRTTAPAFEGRDLRYF
jgi:hypothetical protein